MAAGPPVATGSAQDTNVVLATVAVESPPTGTPPNMTDLLRRVGDAPMVRFSPMSTARGYHVGSCIQQLWEAWLGMEGVEPQQ